jgi:ribonuclease P protein component
MIDSSFRFHGHASLGFVYRQGRVARTTGCSLKYVPNPRRERYRAAVVISKKVSKSAVVRNRIRRRIYEQVRGLMPPHVSYDLVFTVFSADLALTPEKHIKDTVSRLLQVSGILEGEGRGTVENSADQPADVKNYITN